MLGPPAMADRDRAQVYLLQVVHSHTLSQERLLREQVETSLHERCETLQTEGSEARPVI